MNTRTQVPRVTRAQIIARGLTGACPNCGVKDLFEPNRRLRMRRQCIHCGLPFERDEGSFLGAVALNYGVTTVGFLVPVLLCYLAGWLPGLAASIIALAGAFIVPFALYRPSRGWWLMNYYLVFPEQLPANNVREEE